MECNPATVSREKAELFRAIGVNRVSMGVQSFDEQLLERLGRIHSREQVFKSYEVLRSVFENINIDLMFGIPTQTMEVWKATLGEATARLTIAAASATRIRLIVTRSPTWARTFGYINGTARLTAIG